MKIRAYSELAKYYDLVYHRKQYGKEADFLENIFRTHGQKVKSVLDIACGTAVHDIFLARRGFRIVGIDSSKEMIAIAKKRAKSEKLKIDFHQQDMRKIGLKERFDVAICMFSSFNHLLTVEDAKASVASIRNVLKKNGIFVLDLPNPISYFKMQPTSIENGESDKTKLVRVATLENFPETSSAKLHLSYVIHEGSKTRLDFETWDLRYYSREEMVKLLTESGFKIVGVYGNFGITEEFDENNSRRIIIVGRNGSS